MSKQRIDGDMKAIKISSSKATFFPLTGLIYINQFNNDGVQIEDANILIEDGLLRLFGMRRNWDAILGFEGVDISLLETKPLPEYIKTGFRYKGWFRKDKYEYVKGWYRTQNTPFSALMNNWRIIDNLGNILSANE